jgi:transmembrane sensor
MRTQDIESMAAHWLVELNSQNSPEQSNAFQEWLNADIRHQSAFERQRSAWIACDGLKTLRPLDGSIDLDVLMHCDLPEMKDQTVAISSEPTDNEKVPSSSVFRVFRRQTGPRQSIAIAVLLGVAAGILFSFGGFNPHTNTYTTGVGGRELIALEDGSWVELNTDSEIRVRFTDEARGVDLIRGEALFHVSHDAGKPLTVIAGEDLVQVLGTEFSVHLQNDHQVRVIVTEGSVRVVPPVSIGSRAHSDGTVISAGSMASIQRNIVTRVSLDPGDISRRIAWRSGLLAFSGQTLTDVVTEFNRYNQQQLLIADPSIKDFRIGGTFEATDLDSFLTALHGTFGVQADSTYTDRRIVRLRSQRPPGQ